MSTNTQKFQYAGIEFEVESEFGQASLTDEHKLFWDPTCSSPIFARVHCKLIQTPKPVTDLGGREIECEYAEHGFVIKTRGLTATLKKEADHTFHVTADTFPDSLDFSPFLTAISGLILQQEGGLILHASGVYLPVAKQNPSRNHGNAFLFIGPSGAGKTTTGNLVDGGYWFAKDRAAIYPTKEGWKVWGMASGDPLHIEKLAFHGLPLTAIFRVKKEEKQPFIETLVLPQKLSFLRESTQMLDLGLQNEQLKLDQLLQLSQGVKVAAIHPVIHQPVTNMLSTWITQSNNIDGDL